MTARERGRRKLVAIVTLIYLLLIFEGVLRKWLFPSVSQALFFVRDPFVLMAFWLAFRHGFIPQNNPFLMAGAGIAFAAFLLVAVQVLSAGGSAEGTLLLAAYGWRNYFLYLPLGFVVGAAFQRPDLERIVKLTMIVAVPMALLVFLQFSSPLNSPINVGIADEAAAQFRGLAVDMDHTRPMGTFTSDVGQKQFVVSALAMALALWVMPAARRFVKLWQLLPVTAAILCCLAVSGSRGAMLHSGIVVAGALFCAGVIRRNGVGMRALLWPSLIAVAAVGLYPIVFPEGYSSFMGRWDAAALVESRSFRFGIFGRALYSFVDFFHLLADTPLAGYGLGLAGNARLILGIDIPGFTGWAETDWARHIVDLGPVIGIVFIVYRIALVSWLAMRCLNGGRRNGDPLPVLLLAFVSVELLYGQISGHGTINGYAWLFMGFCLAAAAPPQPETASEASASKVPVPPRFANLMR